MQEQMNLFDAKNIGAAQMIEHPLFLDLRPHIVTAFWRYHQLNPHIFDLYKKFAYQLKNSGRQMYGSKSIIERIRWHVSVDTVGEEFKISNNHGSCYARLMIITDESFKIFFKMRGRNEW